MSRARRLVLQARQVEQVVAGAVGADGCPSGFTCHGFLSRRIWSLFRLRDVQVCQAYSGCPTWAKQLFPQAQWAGCAGPPMQAVIFTSRTFVLQCAHVPTTRAHCPNSGTPAEWTCKHACLRLGPSASCPTSHA